MQAVRLVPILIFVVLPLTIAEKKAPEAKPISIRSTKQLFLDDLIVERMDNCQMQFHRPVRYQGNPLLEADKRWEQNGNGVQLFGGTVIYDEEEKDFKMWYRTHVVETTPKGNQIGVTPEGGYRACYATSRDGLHWEKPNLGLVSYGDSTDNNMLPPGVGGSKHIRRPNLIKDYQERDPEKRYKMVYMDEMEGRFGLAKGYSRDGIHWRMNVGRPIFFEPPARPNGELFGWDPRISKYVLFHPKGGYIPADVDGRKVRSDFALLRSTSRDFEDWGESREIITRNDQIDPDRWSPSHAGTMAAILYTDDLYIGFLDTCMTHNVEDVPESLWGVYSIDHAEHRTELVTSRDGLHWKRVAPHWWFLAPALWGTWDREHVALSKPIVRNDQILIYYTGHNVPCGAGNAGHLQNHLIHKIVDGQRVGYAIGLATMRLDGFASIEGYEDGGSITTKPLLFEGNRLVINARAPKKPFSGVSVTDPQTGQAAKSHGTAESSYGKLKVEILNIQGRALSGYKIIDCDNFSGDEIRHEVTWKGKGDLSGLAGKPIRLKFYLQNAALYSFHFTGEYSGPVSLLCPGCRGRP
jgi:hypothetical protein